MAYAGARRVSPFFDIFLDPEGRKLHHPTKVRKRLKKNGPRVVKGHMNTISTYKPRPVVEVTTEDLIAGKHLEVWLDDTAGPAKWIVSMEDGDSTTTLRVFDTQDEASMYTEEIALEKMLTVRYPS